jgi:small subunit ribosomal protein S6
MRRYETIIILDPDISAEERTPVFDRISDTIAQGDGFLVLLDDWGARKLAYEIKKKVRGHYTRFDYCGTGAIVDEIERFCRIDDRLMKYLTVMIDENADVEKIKKDIARVSNEKAEAEKAEQPDAVEDKPPVDSVETETKEQAGSEGTDAAENEPPADSVETDAEGQAESDEAVTTETEVNDIETKKED